MRTLRTALFAVFALLSALPARADFDPTARARAVAPFVDEQAILVARLDVERLDPDALWQKADKFGLGFLEQEPELRQQAQALRKMFLDAGGEDLYLVVSSAYMTGRKAGRAGFLVAPVSGDGDAAALAALAPGAAVMGSAVVFGPGEILEKLRDIRPAPRPELPAAFAAAGDTAAQLILLPTADNRRVIEETLPVLPEELGGGPSTAFTRGALWAALGVDVAPEASVGLTFQSENPAAARSLAAALEALKQAVGGAEKVRQALPQYEAVSATLTPAVEGDRLRLSLDDAALSDLSASLFGPLVSNVRREAAMKASRNVMRMIHSACYWYSKEHDGEWPEDLAAAFTADRFASLSNPRWPERRPGYVYIRPAKDAPWDTVVLYEDCPSWPAGGIWVQRVSSAAIATRCLTEKELKKLLEAQKPAPSP